MRTHTNDFKNEIKMIGKQINSKITYISGSEEIELGKNMLNSITMAYDGNILKSVMKKLEIDSNEEIPLDTILKYEFGLKVGSEYEWINYGNFVVNKVEKQENTNSYIITCYDKMLYSMVDYDAINLEYPVTVRTYINAVATNIGLVFNNNEDEFCNYDKLINEDLYKGQNLKYRDVLDQLAEVTGSVICINDNDELEIRYPNETNDTINESYLKDVNVKFGEKFGPVNSIVLSRSAESDNVYLQDEESLVQNGLCEIKIKDNQIMNFNDRDTYLPDLLETLDGLEFYMNDFSSTGITYYDMYDFYNIQVGENTYKCLMLNDDIEVNQGLEELIYTERPDKSETDYSKADKTDNKINQTTLIVNKQTGEIEALTSRVQNTEDSLNNTYTIEQVNTLVQNAIDGVTNQFIVKGGNNLLRNTGLWATTDDENNPYEFWNGLVERVREENAVNSYALLLQNNTLSQQVVDVKNGTYTLSFNYKKLITLSNPQCIINDKVIDLTEEENTPIEVKIEVGARTVDLSFITDVDNSCIVYDLMLNSGESKSEYSQNENETTTDTVNISKGITITSTETDVTFKANSTGIRTLDRYGNKKTEFTDIGMETSVANITEEAQITGLLHRKVGNHVWVTKL